MAAEHVVTDDDIRRFRSVFLGAPGHTWFFHASYAAYGVFTVVFLLLLMLRQRTPLDLSIVWMTVLSMLTATVVVKYADHDRSIRALARNVYLTAALPQVAPHPTSRERPIARRIKITRTPL